MEERPLENDPLASAQLEKLKLEIDLLKEQRDFQVQKLELETSELQIRNKWANRTAQYIPLITVIVTVAGFCFGVYQFRSQQRENFNRTKTERDIEIAKQTRQHIEKELAGFYYPISMRLKIDDALWPKLSNMQDQKLRLELEKSIVLPNQEEILKIILQNPEVLKEDEKLREQVFKFIKHAVIQKSLRQAAQFNRDAISEDEGWPADFEPAIDKQAAVLQARYNRCVSSPDQCK